MRDDEENYPEWMIRDRRRDKLGRTGDGGLDEDLEATSNIKIARYGVDMMSALVSTDEQETWEELLRIAAQEDDESMVRYSAQRLFPFAPKKEIELVKVWLAMRPERFERLKMELLQHVNQAERAAWNCRNVLELAAHLDLPEFVRWLLRSYGWSRKQRKDAKGLVPELNTTSKWTSVWEVPFLHVARKGVRNTGYRNPCEVDSSIAMFQSSIMNFYNSGTYTHFLHHLCGVHDLLYNGKKGPVRIMKGVAKTFRDTFPELNTDTYDDSHLKYRWIHLPANCVSNATWLSVPIN
jgi:hypothetical protein